MDALDKASNFYSERMGVVKLKDWSSGRAVLLGDAAYCPSPNTGMGTTCALVGAYILAGQIGVHCNDQGDGRAVAFAAYEATMRRYVRQVQRGIEEEKASPFPATKFGVAIAHCCLGLLALFHVNIGRWFACEVKGWRLPQYAALDKSIQ